MLGLTGTQRSEKQKARLLSAWRISGRVSYSPRTDVVAGAYFPPKRHDPTTATDSSTSAQAWVAGGYWKEELIKKANNAHRLTTGRAQQLS